MLSFQKVGRSTSFAARTPNSFDWIVFEQFEPFLATIIQKQITLVIFAQLQLYLQQVSWITNVYQQNLYF